MDLLDLLNLTGPKFLIAYLFLLAGAVALAKALVWASRTPSEGPDFESVALDPYEVAYLTGGDEPAADAAIASLVHRGAVTVYPAERMIKAREAMPPGLHRLERAVAPDTEAKEYERTIAAARKAAKPALEVTRKRLATLGLLMDDGPVWSARLLQTIPILTVLLLGLAKIQVGLSRDKPVGFLVVLCLVTGLIEFGFVVMRPHRSRWGDHMLKHLRLQNAALRLTGSRRAADLAGQDLALAVALFGTGILAGGPLNDLRTALAPPPSSGGGGDSGGGDSGGGWRMWRGRMWWMRGRRLMGTGVPPLGLGLGWRPELALMIERHRDLQFVEVLAEDLDASGSLPAPIERLRDRGITVVPHGVTLSLGGAEPLDRTWLEAFGRLATRLGAPWSASISPSSAPAGSRRGISSPYLALARCWTCSSPMSVRHRKRCRSLSPWRTWRPCWSGLTPRWMRRRFSPRCWNAPAPCSYWISPTSTPMREPRLGSARVPGSSPARSGRIRPRRRRRRARGSLPRYARPPDRSPRPRPPRRTGGPSGPARRPPRAR